MRLGRISSRWSTFPFRQQPLTSAFFFVRTSVPPNHAAPAVRAAVALDPDVIVEDFTTLKAMFAFDRDFMDLEHSELRKHTAMANILAAIALLLAAIGLYAVIAYSIGQRTKEIGVRIAIGAAAQDIGRLVFREGLSPSGIGMIVGLLASLGVNRVLQSQLVGVSPVRSRDDDSRARGLNRSSRWSPARSPYDGRCASILRWPCGMTNAGATSA